MTEDEMLINVFCYFWTIRQTNQSMVIQYHWANNQQYPMPVPIVLLFLSFFWISFQCFGTVSWATGRASGSSKIQNGDILVLAKPGPPGKPAVKTEFVVFGMPNYHKYVLSFCRRHIRYSHICRSFSLINQFLLQLLSFW